MNCTCSKSAAPIGGTCSTCQGTVVAFTASPGSLPPYEEWRKLPSDEAARLLSIAWGWDAETESLTAAALEWFGKSEDSAENGEAIDPEEMQ